VSLRLVRRQHAAKFSDQDGGKTAPAPLRRVVRQSRTDIINTRQS